MKDINRRLVTSSVIGLCVFALFAVLLVKRDNDRKAALDLMRHVDSSQRARARNMLPFLERMDNAAFDFFFNRGAAMNKEDSRVCDDVVAITVDQASIEAARTLRGYERWPWNRVAWQKVLAFLSRGRPKAVIFDLIFAEPHAEDPTGTMEWPPGSGVTVGMGDMAFLTGERQAGNVYLSYHFLQSRRKMTGRDIAVLRSLQPSFVQTGTLFPAAFEQKGRLVDYPFECLREGAKGLGWIDAEPDPDFALRRSALVVRHESVPGKLLPCIALSAVMRREPGLVSVDASGRLLYKGRALPVGDDGRYIIRWTGHLFERYAHYPVGLIIKNQMKLEGFGPETIGVIAPGDIIDPAVFRDKYVVVGTTFSGGTDIKATPFGAEQPGMVKHLTILEGLLSGRFMHRVETGLTLLLILLLCLVGAGFYQFVGSAFRSSLIFCILGFTHFVVAAQLFFHYDYQLDMAAPELALLTTFLISVTWNYFVEDRAKRLVRKEFQSYLSPEVVDKLLDDPDSIRLGGERRILTAYFSDLANFTTMSEQLEPEELVVLINEYLECQTEDIINCGGYLDKFQGDGIMAVFGVERGQTMHALDACRAALANQRSLAVLRARWLAEGKPHVSVRIGINTGPMIAGNVGYERKKNFTILGDSVNLAARLEGANKAYGTALMIGENTYREVRDHVIARELDLLAVKGKKKGVRVFELLALVGEDELSEEQKELFGLFAEALELYKQREFGKALRKFREALGVVPDDGPSKTYIARCELYEKEPPDSDWDGVFRMKTK